MPAIACTMYLMTGRTVDCPHCHRCLLLPDQPTASAVCPACGKQFGVSKEIGTWGTHPLVATSNTASETVRHGLPGPDEGLPELEYEEEEPNPFRQHGRPVPPPVPPFSPPPVDPGRAWLVKGVFLVGFVGGCTACYAAYQDRMTLGILLLVGPIIGIGCGVVLSCLFVLALFEPPAR